MSQPNEFSLLLHLNNSDLLLTVLSFLVASHPHVLIMIRQVCRLFGRGNFESAVRNYISNTPPVGPGCGRFSVRTFDDARNWCLLQRLGNQRYRSNALSGNADTKTYAIAIHPEEHVVFVQCEHNFYIEYRRPLDDGRMFTRHRLVHRLQSHNVTDLRFGGPIPGTVGRECVGFYVFVGYRGDESQIYVFGTDMVIVQTIDLHHRGTCVRFCHELLTPGQPTKMFWSVANYSVYTIEEQPDGMWRILTNLPYMDRVDNHSIISDFVVTSSEGVMFSSNVGNLWKFTNERWNLYSHYSGTPFMLFVVSVGTCESGRPREWCIMCSQPTDDLDVISTIGVDFPEGEQISCFGNCASVDGDEKVSFYMLKKESQLVSVSGGTRARIYNLFVGEDRRFLDFVCHMKFDLSFQRDIRYSPVSVRLLTLMHDGRFWIVARTNINEIPYRYELFSPANFGPARVGNFLLP